uniref:PAZ domain-containing protein n=1 Tax=Chromera velia CCMP2878 TaxID=1169474 RepID=A0A0G4HWK0_9ALVE|eukprot:Cvel_32700.t1-p1 / transcript=Cvel_32700.t1 / gene=Cvel_32700 / organism=Chromera_velia_CCMP2878 / gene_product=hypothetical protein / transcript_product=hypothetical protein / location=Cvel_scaffold5146:2371-4848(-) / protein_length=826 / sequence_SO=supercontig / SO=protein_coding / is_pseudo=false
MTPVLQQEGHEVSEGAVTAEATPDDPPALPPVPDEEADRENDLEGPMTETERQHHLKVLRQRHPRKDIQSIMAAALHDGECLDPAGVGPEHAGSLATSDQIWKWTMEDGDLAKPTIPDFARCKVRYEIRNRHGDYVLDVMQPSGVSLTLGSGSKHLAFPGAHFALGTMREGERAWFKIGSTFFVSEGNLQSGIEQNSSVWLYLDVVQWSPPGNVQHFDSFEDCVAEAARWFEDGKVALAANKPGVARSAFNKSVSAWPAKEKWEMWGGEQKGERLEWIFKAKRARLVAECKVAKGIENDPDRESQLWEKATKVCDQLLKDAEVKDLAASDDKVAYWRATCLFYNGKLRDALEVAESECLKDHAAAKELANAVKVRMAENKKKFKWRSFGDRLGKLQEREEEEKELAERRVRLENQKSEKEKTVVQYDQGGEKGESDKEVEEVEEEEEEEGKQEEGPQLVKVSDEEKEKDEKEKEGDENEDDDLFDFLAPPKDFDKEDLKSTLTELGHLVKESVEGKLGWSVGLLIQLMLKRFTHHDAYFRYLLQTVLQGLPARANWGGEKDEKENGGEEENGKGEGKGKEFHFVIDDIEWPDDEHFPAEPVGGQLPMISLREKEGERTAIFHCEEVQLEGYKRPKWAVSNEKRRRQKKKKNDELSRIFRMQLQERFDSYWPEDGEWEDMGPLNAPTDVAVLGRNVAEVIREITTYEGVGCGEVRVQQRVEAILRRNAWIETKHLKSGPRKERIDTNKPADFERGIESTFFMESEQREVSIREYFKKVYKIDLKESELPLLRKTSKFGKVLEFPPEVCWFCSPFQRVNRQQNFSGQW